MEKNIYIILSQTGTKFAKLIRKFGKQRYNHAAICLDDGFERVYAFARPQHNAVLLGGLVKESLSRYTLGQSFTVPAAVFKITISEEEYHWIETTIQKILDNPEYMYNLISVLTHPLFKGFAVKKAFSCIEFVVFLLQHCGYAQSKKRFQYKPDEIANEMTHYLFYEGDIRGCLPKDDGAKSYFESFTIVLFWESTKSLFRIISRTCFQRKE